jgi:hypothetical protein
MTPEVSLETTPTPPTRVEIYCLIPQYGVGTGKGQLNPRGVMTSFGGNETNTNKLTLCFLGDFPINYIDLDAEIHLIIEGYRKNLKNRGIVPIHILGKPY